MKLNLLLLHNYPIYQQLQLEEALLRADSQNWCVINNGSPDAIVMGISGKPESLLCPISYPENPVPLIKRFSGGGTVYVDHNTFFISLICNSINLPHYPQEILKWTEELYKPAFPHSFCVRENDYVIGEKKFGGNAQYICKDRWLHHSTLLWDYDAPKMKTLLIPPKCPTYRNQRSHHDFLCTLNNYLSSKEELQEKLLTTLQARFSITQVNLDHANPILNKPHRKATQHIPYNQ